MTSESNPGDVPVIIDGEEYILACTLSACRQITNIPGGLHGERGVFQRLLNYEFDCYVMVIKVGLGVGPQGLKGIEERIFRTGMSALFPTLDRYLGNIQNGGKPVGEGGADANPQKGETGSPSSSSTET